MDSVRPSVTLGSMELNAHVCVVYFPVHVQRLLRTRERRAWESTVAVRVSRREKQQSGKNNSPQSWHTPLNGIILGCSYPDHWPGAQREGPSVILSQLRTYAFSLKQTINFKAVVLNSSPS